MSDDARGTKTEEPEADNSAKWFVTLDLPPELRHPEIQFYRDVGLPHHEAYQIGFDGPSMPHGYEIPPEYRIQHARIERHHWPGRTWLYRRLLGKDEYIVIVVAERDITEDEDEPES